MGTAGDEQGMGVDGPEVRAFVAALVRAGAPSVPGPTGLAVPEASAEEVIAVARRLALRAVADGRWSPGSAPRGLWGVASAMVVDEHPSSPGWSPVERERVVTWVATLIEHRGEDGVQELLRELNLR